MADRAQTHVSPRDLAAAIDASESSVKRWADEGLLAVHRTSGGHRRISIAEAIRFVRQSNVRVLRPDMLGLPDFASNAGRLVTADHLAELFRRHASGDVVGLIQQGFVDGFSVAEICEGPIRESLEIVGRLCEVDELGIAIEHGAVDACVDGLSSLRRLLHSPHAEITAIGGAVEGDPYMLASLSVALVLAESGYRVLNFGPNTPLEALLPVIVEQQGRLIWRSYGIDLTLSQREAEVERLTPLASAGIDVVVGGRALQPIELMPEGIHAFGSLTELSEFAQTRIASLEPERAKTA